MIYCVEVILARFSDHFSLNRTTIHLKGSKNLPQNCFSSLRPLFSDSLLFNPSNHLTVGQTAHLAHGLTV
jgi:hypothetical protein